MHTARIKRAGFPVIVVGAVLTLFACSGGSSDPCPPNDFVAREYVATGIRDITLQQRTQDRGVLLIDENIAVPIDELEMLVSFDFSAQRVEARSSINILDLLFAKAHACSVAEPIVSVVVDMDLNSNADLGPEFPPGTSLKRAFFAEIADSQFAFIYSAGAESRRLSAYTVDDPAGLSAAYLIKLSLSQEAAAISPQRSELHRFTFTVQLATGEMFEGLTPAVLIN